MSLSRRKFLRNTTFNAAALASIPAIVSSCISSEEKKAHTFNPGDIILFQGDSITDAGREKERELPNNSSSFGPGYAFIAASGLLNSNPEEGLIIYNRGISGNKVFQLAERWEKDCLDLKPNVLSILIGVNDYWHTRKHGYEGTVETFENDLRALLKRTKKGLPGIRLVICQPFILTNTDGVDETWVEPFKAYQDVVAKIATEFDAVWVPFQEAFNEAVKYAPEKYWTIDGVHPSMAGCQLMAQAWLKAVVG
ncbi:MAG: SGNH/GDSL hydrolase family protein [Chlorobi bacterium]|nr:SGNH/GDSL hydrolase family protein [Chlorobiota bacterium]